MEDYIIRGITNDSYIRFFAIKANNLVQDAVNIHKLSVTNTFVLGRTIIAALLMNNDLKNDDDILTLRFQGDGSSGAIVVTSTGRFTVKGYIEHPSNEVPPKDDGTIDISSAVGSGIINVIKSIGNNKPYIGQTEIVSGSIAKDIAYYYMQSEQIPTAIELGVLVNSDHSIRQAGGFLIQLMPDTPEHIIEKLEKNLQAFPNFSDMLDMNYSLDDLMNKFILKDFGIIVNEQHKVAYSCNCSEERFANGLKLLGLDELNNLIDENENITAECHFCNKKYTFKIDDLISLKNEILNEQS
jgi:molecular chaperone Hsp33